MFMSAIYGGSLKTNKWNYPGIPLLVIYPENIIVHKDTCTPVLIAALFTTARTSKDRKCPTIDEWIKKMCYKYTKKKKQIYKGILLSH